MADFSDCCRAANIAENFFEGKKYVRACLDLLQEIGHNSHWCNWEQHGPCVVIFTCPAPAPPPLIPRDRRTRLFFSLHKVSVVCSKENKLMVLILKIQLPKTAGK